MACRSFVEQELTLTSLGPMVQHFRFLASLSGHADVAQHFVEQALTLISLHTKLQHLPHCSVLGSPALVMSAAVVRL
jgi:hypothetical protein